MISNFHLVCNLLKNYNMRKLLLHFLLLLFPLAIFAQEKNSPIMVNVHYFDNYPFAFKDKQGKLAGIEVEIFAAFQKWALEKKGIVVKTNFKSQPTFDGVLNAVKDAKNEAVIGMGSISITPQRETLFDFSSPYLKNKSFLVSEGSAPTLLNVGDLKTQFAGYKALTIKGSIHEENLLAIKAVYQPNLVIEYRNTPAEILKEIAKKSNYFAYVDLITYWYFVNNEQDGFIKIQRITNAKDDYFGFLFQEGDTKISPLFNEFMDAGFGFASSKVYQQIIEKYLGADIIQFANISNN